MHATTAAAQRLAELTALNRHLQTAREDERARLARDLHDELGALLTAAAFDLARVRARLPAADPETLQRLAHLGQVLDSVVAIKRRVIEDLRPSALDQLGLPIALEILGREFGERSGLQVHLALQPVALGPAAEIAAYRLVQEALTNAAKHARARQLWVTLQAAEEGVELGVRDDGAGFDTRLAPPGTYGLAGMRCRVEAEGGTLVVDAAPGHGTHLIATFPAAAPAR